MTSRLALILCGLLVLLLAGPARAEEAPREILVMIRLPATHFRPNAGYGGDYGDAASRTANRKIAERIAKRQGIALVDGWPMPLLGVDCYVMRLRDGQDEEAALAALNRDPEVGWVQAKHIYQAQAAAPGDPLYPVQPAAAWRLDDLHKVSTGRGVRVAVIDSQVEVRHPDLAGQVALERNFVEGRPVAAEDHGTGIAGVIAAKADNGIGIAGIAPGARLLALRACWQDAKATMCDTLSLARALQFAIGGNVQIINLSLSGPPDRLLDRLIDIALARRIAVIAAYDRDAPGGGFPASKAGVIAVADTQAKARPAAVYGAPGTDIPTTQPNGRWYVVSGNSYAAAHVSGLIALVRQQRPAGAARLATVAGRGNEVDACLTLMRTATACDCHCSLAQASGSRGH